MRNPHIVTFGARGVCGFLAATMARAGENLSNVDPWAEHVERIGEQMKTRRLLVWDNDSTQHRAVADDKLPQLRLMKRLVATATKLDSQSRFECCAAIRGWPDRPEPFTGGCGRSPWDIRNIREK